MMTLGKTWVLDAPAPEFQKFERVEITDAPSCWAEFNGEQGVVFCVGYNYKDASHPWGYSIYLPQRNRCPNFKQEWLKSAGSFDVEADHFGQRAEVSFDIALESDNDWVEGTYRLPGEFWKVLIFQKRDVPEIQHDFCEWLPPTTWQPICQGIVFLAS